MFETSPMGGPDNQPIYINAVVVIDGPKLAQLKPSEEAAESLLEKLLNLEKEFGRYRKSSKASWGPRSLDLDLLAWGGLHVNNKHLVLPHPRLIERDFVVVPLAAALKTSGNQPRQVPSSPKWKE